MILFLTACTPPKYPRKSDDNANYYMDYLTEIEVSDYEEIDNMFATEDMNDAYKIAGINQTSKSFFIYHYIGTNNNNEKVHILIPDRVGEENLVFVDHLPSFTDLETYVETYNNSTESTEIDWAGKTVNTNDIVIDEAELRMEVIWHFYTDRTINDVKVEANDEEIRDLLFSNLSSPFVYRVARYYDGGNTVKFIYVGKGIEHDLVFIKFDSSTIEVEIIYNYDFS